MLEISFVTSNKHKFEEISTYFNKSKIRINHLQQQYTELQADTFEKVVASSATSLSTIIDQPFIIEDSGISVLSLNEFPGPYSSYVYKTIGWQGILDLMERMEDRSAYFTSIWALIIDDKIRLFKGITHGKISFEGRGTMGFGFDPIFVPNYSDNSLNQLTYAEMDLEQKNKISHRGKSMMKLKEYLENRGNL